MGAVEVQPHALLISALHQGDWSASSSDLFNIGGGRLGVFCRIVFNLQQRHSTYVTMVRSSWNWLTGVSDVVGLLSVALRSEFLRDVLNRNTVSSWRWDLVAVLCGYCDGLYRLMWFEQEWCLVICCKVFGGEHVGETCNTHVENEKCTPDMTGKHQGKI